MRHSARWVVPDRTLGAAYRQMPGEDDAVEIVELERRGVDVPLRDGAPESRPGGDCAIAEQGALCCPTSVSLPALYTRHVMPISAPAGSFAQYRRAKSFTSGVTVPCRNVYALFRASRGAATGSERRRRRSLGCTRPRVETRFATAAPGRPGTRTR